MPKHEKPKGGGKLVTKGPGDASTDVKTPKFRGEDGYGGDPNSSKKETDCVNYKR